MPPVTMTLTSFAVKSLRFCLNRLMALDRYLHRRVDLRAHNKSIIHSTRKYDMVAAADESYYAEQYWHRIQAVLRSEKVSGAGRFLDLGCGQGRMSIPFATWCGPEGQITAVDLSEHAILQAQRYAAVLKLKHIEFKQADLFDTLRTMDNDSFDVVMMLEVVFFLPDYQRALAEIARVLKPGGLLFVSFRSQYFNILYSLQHGMIGAVETLLQQRSGAFVGGETQFNWHTVPELTVMLNDLNFDIKHTSGIGVCSGIPGDPHAQMVRPSTLSEAERKILMKAEEQLGDRLPEAGRYIFIAARLKNTK